MNAKSIDYQYQSISSTFAETQPFRRGIARTSTWGGGGGGPLRKFHNMHIKPNLSLRICACPRKINDHWAASQSEYGLSEPTDSIEWDLMLVGEILRHECNIDQQSTVVYIIDFFGDHQAIWMEIPVRMIQDKFQRGLINPFAECATHCTSMQCRGGILNASELRCAKSAFSHSVQFTDLVEIAGSADPGMYRASINSWCKPEVTSSTIALLASNNMELSKKCHSNRQSLDCLWRFTAVSAAKTRPMPASNGHERNFRLR